MLFLFILFSIRQFMKRTFLITAVALLSAACTDPAPDSGLLSTGETASVSASAKDVDGRVARFGELLRKMARTRIEEEIVAQGVAARERATKARDEANAKYEAARAQGQKVKAPERPKLPHDDTLQSFFPACLYNNLLAELYDVEHEAVSQHFVSETGELTVAGKLVLEAISRADDHALDAADFAPDKLVEAVAKYGKFAEAASRFDGLSLNDHELESVERALKRDQALNASFLAGESGHAALFDVLVKFDTSPVPRFAAAYETWKARQRFIVKYREQLEFALANALLVWANQMKLGNITKFSKEELDRYTTEDNPNDIHPKYFDEIIEGRLGVYFNEFIAQTDEVSVRAKLDELVPKHFQYGRLQRAREQYREIVSKGGWSEVPADNMNAGGRAPLVKALKKRLAAEGYFGGNVEDDLFDAELTKAITAYQTHHQLDVTGAVGPVFWRSLNVSAEQRLAEIEENIRRWHRAMFVPRDRFIYINIPSFTVELWDQGKLIDRHNVIVGNSTRTCNTRTREWEYMNATRLMHARMTYIVFNPYWNVPPRIEVDEYQKRMAEDPKWLEQSDFEYYTPKGGGRVLRQKPGPNNALGKVKLIFPNRYNIYLHDTPKQEMFSYSVRAFSHGCMRVQKAMDFAESVLKLDGQWDKKAVDKYFSTKGEHAVDLLNPIDVFIEYNTVTVDEEGKAYFLADVYKIIRDQIHPPTALERACDPSVDKVSNFRSGGAAGDTGP